MHCKRDVDPVQQRMPDNLTAELRPVNVLVNRAGSAVLRLCENLIDSAR